MKKLTATATVRSQAHDPLPNDSDVVRATQALIKAGFEVGHIGRFGVSISGEKQLFHDALGVDLPENSCAKIPANPDDPELIACIDKVEIFTTPLSF